MALSSGWTRRLRAGLSIVVATAVLVVGLAAVAGPAAAAPVGGMSAAAVAAMFGSYGDAGGHWTGGDSSVSVLLPDGRVAWLFSDTFLGTVAADGTRASDTPLVNNTLVVQDGTSLVSTLYGGTPAAPEALVKPSQAGEFFWVADAMVEGGVLKVLYNRYRRYDSGPLEVELSGTSLATFALPGLTLSSVVDLPVGRAITWGSAVLADGSYTYIYGSSSGLGGMKFGHVARAPAGSLGGAWEYWTGTAWSTDVTAAARLLSGVGTAYAVEKLGSQYVLITQENNLVFDPQFVAYTASSPTGPFTGPVQLLTAPEQQPGSQKVVYNARLHPELARSGKLLLSYDVNSLNNQDNYTDARLYRPRFVELDWPRPQPDPSTLPAAPTGLTVTSDTAGVVHLRWAAVTGASAYRVHRRDVTGAQTHFARQSPGVTQTSADIGGLIPGHRYEFKVTASNSSGQEGPFSAVVNITPRIARDASMIRFANAPDAVPGRFIVRFKDSPALRAAGVAAFAQELATQSGGSVKHVYALTLRGFEIVATETQAIDLVGHPDVLDVEQDGTVTLDGVQTNPPWGLDRIDQRSNVLDGKYTYPNLGDVHAYVIDSGIRITHNTFGGRASYGTNVLDGSNNADDCNGHGTGVAGTLGGTEYGVAKGVRLVAVKIADCQGRGSRGDIIRGVEWVVDDAKKPANVGKPAVVNMSLSAPAGGDLDNAVSDAIGAGLTVVAAAGNLEADACTRSPARVHEVIAVGNVDSSDRRYSPSGYGPCVDIFAPGTNIVTANSANDTGSKTGTGTSYAAPHVAGAAAMVLAAHPDYSPTEVSDALSAAATPDVVQDAGTGSPNRLLFVEQPPTHAPANLTATANSDGTIHLSWDAVPEENVQYLVSQRDVTAGETTFKRWDVPVTSGTTATATSLFAGHTYEFTVAASNSTGIGPESNVASAVASVAPPAAPTNLAAAAQSDGTIKLSWTASPTADVWYWVYQRDVTAGEASFTQLPLPVTQCWLPVTQCCTMTAGYLTHDHQYEYQVSATNSGGESARSNVASATARYPLPAAPSGLTATAGDGQAVLSWTASPTEGAWYWVYQRDVTAGEASFTKLQLPVTQCCTMTAGYLINGHAYEFKVSALSQGGESGASNVVTVTPTAPLPAAPTGLSATAQSDGTIKLSWTAPAPNLWYVVYYRDATAGQAWQKTSL